MKDSHIIVKGGNEMKQSERIKLAEECYRKIKTLNLKVEIKGNWIHLSPPKNVTVDLIHDMANCAEQLVKLF